MNRDVSRNMQTECELNKYLPIVISSIVIGYIFPYDLRRLRYTISYLTNIQYVAESGLYEYIEQILKIQNLPTYVPRLVLIGACRGNNIQIARLAIKYGADCWYTALIVAILCRNKNIITWMIKKGARIDANLLESVDNLEILEILLKYKRVKLDGFLTGRLNLHNRTDQHRLSLLVKYGATYKKNITICGYLSLLM